MVRQAYELPRQVQHVGIRRGDDEAPIPGRRNARLDGVPHVREPHVEKRAPERIERPGGYERTPTLEQVEVFSGQIAYLRRRLGSD